MIYVTTLRKLPVKTMTGMFILTDFQNQNRNTHQIGKGEFIVNHYKRGLNFLMYKQNTHAHAHCRQVSDKNAYLESRIAITHGNII